MKLAYNEYRTLYYILDGVIRCELVRARILYIKSMGGVFYLVLEFLKKMSVFLMLFAKNSLEMEFLVEFLEVHRLVLLSAPVPQ